MLSRLATQIAHRLRGNKAIYTPHVDTGDFIVVTNVERIVVTGNKVGIKYFRHSGYPGGVSETNFKEDPATFPRPRPRSCRQGMLPKGPLGYAMLKKLKCYAGAQHPAHRPAAQGALEILRVVMAEGYFWNGSSQERSCPCFHEARFGCLRRQWQAHRWFSHVRLAA